MEATRMRLSSTIEWVLAGIFFFAALGAASIALREFNTAGAVIPVTAQEPAPAETPAGVPSRAVSVPLLLLPDGRSIKVGDSAAQAAAKVGQAIATAAETIERTPLGERVTRFFASGDARFVLVLEALAHDAEQRVAAIYVQ